MMTSAATMPGDTGPHQRSCGSAYFEPRIRKHTTSPRFDGLNRCRSPTRITYFERSEIAATAAKIGAPRRLHQSPCSVPGTRRMKATPLPVSSALAGHMITRRCQNAIDDSSTAQVKSETRICAIDRSKPSTVCPSACSEKITDARCRRGSVSFGSSNG